MASPTPTTMRAIALDRFSDPKDYNLATIPVPKIQKDDEVLIKIHAASVNPVDVKLSSPSIGPMMDTKAWVTLLHLRYILPITTNEFSVPFLISWATTSLAPFYPRVPPSRPLSQEMKSSHVSLSPTGARWPNT